MCIRDRLVTVTVRDIYRRSAQSYLYSLTLHPMPAYKTSLWALHWSNFKVAKKLKWSQQIRKHLQLAGSRPIDFCTGTAKWVEPRAPWNKPDLWSEWGLNSRSLDLNTLQRVRGSKYCNICFNCPLICVAASYIKSPRYTLVLSEITATF